MFTRRRLLAAIALVPAVASAHDGHDLSKIEAAVVAKESFSGGLDITLRITNGRDTAVRLEAAYSEIGDILWPDGQEIASQDNREFSFQFDTPDWPGIFALILDFGEAGQGLVTIIPT